MTIKLKPFKIYGEISAIASKSFAHRIAICEFLAGREITAGGSFGLSKDITATVNALKDLKENKNVLNCEESGSTLRFLIPLVSALGKDATLTGKGRLLMRPNGELISALSNKGAEIVQKGEVKISGKLKSGDFYIKGDVSSQFVSGLLMALPILKGDSKIILTSPLSSKPYVDITLLVMKSFGVAAKEKEYGYFISGGQKYEGSLTPEGDYSNSAFFMAMGALNGSVNLVGLNANSVQGDKIILDILKDFGAKVSIDKNGIKVEKGEYKPFTFSADSCPDVVPVASALASFAKGKSVIKNVERLRLKESDRIQSVIDMLLSFNIKAEYSNGDLIIYGGEPRAVKPVDSYNDHRIVMASATLGSLAKDETVIVGAEAVSKSYPEFFKDLNSLGGNAYEI